MKWLWIALGTLVLLLALLWVVGSFLPREHRATCRARFRASAEVLFALLSDVDGQAAWRPEVKSMRRAEPVDGKPSFVEESSQGSVRYVVELDDPPRQRVLRIADDSLPYGGTWTFRLEPDAAGTTLAITEDGFVKPPLFRALARFVFGYHATMESTLTALAAKLGETVTVERVE
jgi:polyketide cyclase/dehydrase/lipid transport protein